MRRDEAYHGNEFFCMCFIPGRQQKEHLAALCFELSWELKVEAYDPSSTNLIRNYTKRLLSPVSQKG